jgi:hypothetical protein
MRALYAGRAGDPSVWRSMALLAALTVLAFAWSARLFSRMVR